MTGSRLISLPDAGFVARNRIGPFPEERRRAVQPLAAHATVWQSKTGPRTCFPSTCFAHCGLHCRQPTSACVPNLRCGKTTQSQCPLWVENGHGREVITRSATGAPPKALSVR
jgi:hypothetical protein